MPGSNIIEILLSRVREQADKPAYTFLADGEAEELQLTYRELWVRACAIAAVLQQRGAAGHTVLLLYPPGLDYVATVFGSIMAGAIAVLAFPPRLNRPAPRVRAIAADADATLVLTTRPILDDIERRLSQTPELTGLKWIATDEIAPQAGQDWRRPDIRSDSLVFLQYTSGSTSEPRGVMITHGNLLHNLHVIAHGFQTTEADRGVIWLPMYHDMGLVGGVLAPAYCGIHVSLMPPVSFLQRPIRWLQAISRSRGTVSGGPSFAYRLCVDRIKPEQCMDLDLSSWRLAFCGAEQVHESTLAQFRQAFAPYGFQGKAFYPCYGMAEATLMVSGGRGPSVPVVHTVSRQALERHRIVDQPDGYALVGCGAELLDTRIIIVEPKTRTACPPDQVGEIWVAGPSISQGYWKRPQETEENFRAFLADTGDGPFLRTGDLGYLRDGQLFLTGRIKDLIVIRGHNHYPQDIEDTVAQSHPALRAGGGAAFSIPIDGAEQLVVVQELEKRQRDVNADEVIGAIRAAVAEQHGLQVHAVALVKTFSIAKTSSGKAQRHVCRAAFLAGTLETVTQWTRGPATESTSVESSSGEATVDTIRGWLIRRIASRLKIDSEAVDVRAPFVNLGLDSLDATSLAGDLEVWLARRLSPTLLFDFPNIEILALHLAGTATHTAPDTAGHSSSWSNEPIAIIGIGCRFPGAAGPEAFWRLLAEGIDPITEIPPDRWSSGDYYDPDPMAPGKMNTRWGGFLDNIDQFDPQFFHISRREAAYMDPQQRLLLEISWEAMEDAGHASEQLAGSQTGVFIGISTGDYARLQLDDAGVCDAYSGTGNAFSIAANRISYTFDFRGPSLAVDTACSSSLVAIHLACRSLRSGECSLALAGGVNLILSPAVTLNFSRARLMSADGRCKAFDASADGYVRSEGAGVVIMKPLSTAVADGDRIYAIIRGTAVNQDGRTNGLMAPSGLAQEQVIRAACCDAGVAPCELQYVEAHGTGTLLGDPIEAKALGAVLQSDCLIGSVKSNIGHLEAAAGIAGLIKVALMLQQGQIPRHLHFEKPNPYIPFEELRLRVPQALMRWPENGKQATAGVSSFGFGGTNAHAVLSRAPAVAEPDIHNRLTALLLPLAAHTPQALAELIRRYRSFASGDVRLHDMCYTAARRTHHRHRAAFAFRSREELLEQLASEQVPCRNSKVAFVFGGHTGRSSMGGELFVQEPVFRSAFQECERSGNRAEFALQIALAALLKHWGVVPDAVIGHIVGEIEAAQVLEALGGPDSLRATAAQLEHDGFAVVQALIRDGITDFVELGPEPCLHIDDQPICVLPSLRHGEDQRLTMLRSLGVLYSHGHDINWQAVYPSGFRIPLPSYPWQRERYWLENNSCIPHQGHPLLGRNVPLASARGDRVWESRLSLTRLPYLQDHRIQGVAVLPGAAYLEMALAAVSGMGSLKDIEFRAPLFLSDNRELTVQLWLSPAGAFRIFGRPDGEQSWTLHACGSVDPAPCEPQPPANLELIQQRCPQEISAAEYYQELYTHGLHYGARFQGIRRVWRGAGEALGQVAATENLIGSGYYFHPAVLDACAQVVLAAHADGGRSFVPDGLERITFYGRPEARMWSHTRLRPDQGESVVGDVRLLGDSGRLLVQADGVCLCSLNGNRKSTAGDDWLYEMRWERQPLGAQSSTPPGPWLLIRDQRGKAEELARCLGASGQECTTAAATEALQGYRGVVYLTSLDARDPADPEDCARILQLVQEISRGRSSARLWIVTQDTQPVGEVPVNSGIGGAPLWGLGRTIAQEHAGLWGGLIDIDHDTSMDLLRRELLTPDGENQVAFRLGDRFVARLARRQLSASSAAVNLRTDGTYLITGGLGGLGMQAARWMAEHGARRIILMGRTLLPPRADWGSLDPASRAATQVASIRELEARGVSVHIAAVDVAEQAELAAFFDTFRREGWPPIRGVVHAAGVLQDQILIRLDPASLVPVFRAKVTGAWLLEQLLREAPVEWFVYFSSAAGLLGSAGQASYAAANAYLDSFAHHLRARGKRVLSISWGPWEETGMAVRTATASRLVQGAITAIPTQAGLKLFGRLLASGLTHVAVLPMNWAQLFAAYPHYRRSPLLSHLAAEHAGEQTGPVGTARELILSAPQEEQYQALEDQIAAQVACVLAVPVDGLDRSQPLNDLGIDSLMGVELTQKFETELGVSVPVMEILQGPSIAGVTAVVLKQLVGEIPAKPVLSLPIVSTIQANGSQPPFFFIHPGALDILCYSPLSECLGEDQPFYALQPRELDNYRPERRRGSVPLEQVAQRCVESIRAKHPRGPYYLGGWSLGGVVAFEIAQQLYRAGEDIPVVAIFDSPAPGSAIRNATYEDVHLVPVFARYLRARVGKKLEPKDAVSELSDLSKQIGTDGDLAQLSAMYEYYKSGLSNATRQLEAYRPDVYPGRIVLFRTTEVLEAFERVFPNAVGIWSQLCSQSVEVYDVLCDHYTMFLEPQVRLLAENLNRVLTGLGREGSGANSR